MVLTLVNMMLMSQDPVIRPLAELDSRTLQNLLPELPLWVKNPDYDRVILSLYLFVLINLK
jgi:hypothetical protein